MNGIETYLLRAFVAIADLGGVTKAAESLHTTQSAVSGQLRRLEDQLGCQLFYRTTRSVHLTPSGAILLSYAKSILQLHSQALRSLRRADQPRTLRLGLSEGVDADLLFSTLGQFAEAHPELHVEVFGGICVDLARQVEAGDLDLMIGSVCSTSDAGKVLWSDRVVWAASATRPVGGNDVDGPIPLAVLQEPCPFRDAAIATLTAEGVDWNLVFSAYSASTLFSAVHQGYAITALPAWLLGPGLRTLDDAPNLPPLPLAHMQILASNTASDATARQALAGFLSDALLRTRQLSQPTLRPARAEREPSTAS